MTPRVSRNEHHSASTSSYLSLPGERCKSTLNSAHQKKIRSESTLRQTNRMYSCPSLKGGRPTLVRSSHRGEMMYLHHFTKPIPMGFAYSMAMAIFFLSQVAASQEIFIETKKDGNKITGWNNNPNKDANGKASFSQTNDYQKKCKRYYLSGCELDLSEDKKNCTLYDPSHTRENDDQLYFIYVRSPEVVCYEIWISSGEDGLQPGLFQGFLKDAVDANEKKEIVMKMEYKVGKDSGGDHVLRYDSFLTKLDRSGWMIVYRLHQSDDSVKTRLGFSPETTYKHKKASVWGHHILNIFNIWRETDEKKTRDKIQFGPNTIDNRDLKWDKPRKTCEGPFITFLESLKEVSSVESRRRLQTTRAARRLRESERSGHNL